MMTPIRFASCCRAILLLLACITLNGRPAQAASQDLVLRNVSLIDGRGGVPVARATVVIRDGRITRIARARSIQAPVGATELDLSGRWLIPGLIDAHVHVATDPTGNDADARIRLMRSFRGGVTMVRDMGGDAIALGELARWSDSTGVAAPRVRYSALFGGPSFFSDPRTIASAHGGVPGVLPWLQGVTDSTDLPAAVDAARGIGATGIKIYADLPAERVSAIVREAHRQKLTVWSHATVYPSLPSDAVAAGVDVLSHVMYLVWQTERPVPASYRDGRAALRALTGLAVDSAGLVPVLERMRERKVMLEPTLFVVEAQPSLQKILPWCRAVTGLAHRHGVPLVAGTDNLLGEGDSLPNLHRELELLVESGLSPLEALTAATRNGARALGLGKTHGTIETGKIADLVVLDADPTASIGNTRRVRMVIKNGRVYDVTANATAPASSSSPR
jgi:imidazolonepropionase-like amidohydrolase